MVQRWRVSARAIFCTARVLQSPALSFPLPPPLTPAHDHDPHVATCAVCMPLPAANGLLGLVMRKPLAGVVIALRDALVCRRSCCAGSTFAAILLCSWGCSACARPWSLTYRYMAPSSLCTPAERHASWLGAAHASGSAWHRPAHEHTSRALAQKSLQPGWIGNNQNVHAEASTHAVLFELHTDTGSGCLQEGNRRPMSGLDGRNDADPAKHT